MLHGTVKPLRNWELNGGPNVQYAVLLSPELQAAKRGYVVPLPAAVDGPGFPVGRLTNAGN